MIINSALKRIALGTIILLLLFLFSIFPKTNHYELNPSKTVEYVSGNTNEIYLLDANNLIGRTSIILKSKTQINKVREVLEILVIDGKRESVIPNGFRAIIPSDTKILGLELDGEIVKVNFSKDLLDVTKHLEEKLIEALTYSLTSIEGVKGVIIYIEDVILNVLPQSGKRIPPILKRDFGVNKVYDIKTISNINDVTIYYINKHDDNYYYVPVTKYSNDNRDKIKIIIDELSSGPIYETNLMSFLNSNTKLLNYEIKEQTMILDFNSYLFDSLKDKKVLEEVIYSISLSVGVNYDVNEVIFRVDDEEIEKSTIRSIE